MKFLDSNVVLYAYLKPKKGLSFQRGYYGEKREVRRF